MKKILIILLLGLLAIPLISNSEEIVIRIGNRILIIGEVVGEGVDLTFGVAPITFGATPLTF